MQKQKAFGVWSAVLLGVGSMVGAGIFIVIGQAGAIAGNIVWLSFVFGGIAALLSGYSLAKLALRYPSRGGIVEYLVQGFGKGVFSGSASVLFYFAQLIALGAVAKSFGTYATTFMHHDATLWSNVYAVGIILFFTLVNLLGALSVAKIESFIVLIKVFVLVVFAIAAFFTIDPKLLSSSDMPPFQNMLFAIGLTFFAYQGFSIITNTVEDMQDPQKNMLKAMVMAILFVALLYILTSLAVLGNLPLSKVIATKDYALAEAAKPIFGALGFKIMAITALIATASAINATLYATTEISYTLAKEGELPKIYEYNVFHSFEGLIISALLTIPMVLFMSLGDIAMVASLVVLIIQGLTHIAHLFKIKETQANSTLILLAALFMFGIAALTLYYTSQKNPLIAYYLLGAFLFAFFVEVFLRIVTKREISAQFILTKQLSDEAKKMLEIIKKKI